MVTYKVYGYRKSEQVRDVDPQSSVAALFFEFFRNPRPGEVYSLGGGRENTLSILVTIGTLDETGFRLEYEVTRNNRTGDHVCYERTSRTTEAMGTK
jgi:CDP-paratose 2-epimerase